MDSKTLKTGDYVVDEGGTVGQVKYGHWRNVGIHDVKEGDGYYIVWDDDDWSEVGFEYMDFSKIKKKDKPGFYT